MRVRIAIQTGRLWLAAALSLAASAACAEIGPCVPDGTQGFANRGLVCGSGAGAARVIDGTISPDGAKALAWRSEGSPPNEEPDDTDKIDLLVLRLKDGRILFRATTGFWETTNNGHANRRSEYAVWSADGRWLIESYHTRFETEALRGFAFDAKGEPSHEVDLLPLVDGALRKAAKRVPGVDNLSLALEIRSAHSKLLKDGVYSLPDAAIDRAGHARLKAYLWAPKDGPLHYYQVRLELPRKPGAAASVIGVNQLNSLSEEAK
jgi:hypothetical protein